ncbi:MAG: HupE/UreJ family protein [Sphingobacteriales bacterium]|nr:MAG: HupE/UreJ family protein [Sphingobacteriales bacterium]
MQDFSMYFGLGWDHIISRDALDHILFIVALTVIYRLADWKRVVILVTAFTVGHFLTLILSVTDVIRANSEWVEFLIPSTIVITALFNLFKSNLQPASATSRYILALLFGLVHGLGYANAIRFLLIEEQGLGWSLFAFNLGLEIGQIVVVLAALIIGEWVLRYTPLQRRFWVVIVSSIVLLVAMNMVIDRIPNI